MEIGVMLVGVGNGGKAFLDLLEKKKEEVFENLDCKINIVATATKSHGNTLNGSATSLSTNELINEASYDVLIEATPLNIFSGEPAISHIKGALNRGRDVVTANKGPIAWAFRELKDLAKEKGCLFFYETTVMDGAPIFNLKDYALPFCKVTKIEGILNSTTNYILEEMEKGIPYDEIISQGKKRGFVEDDATLDIEGYDSAAKVTALINVLMGGDITPNMIDRKGIEDITLEDIKEARKNDEVIKLICQGYFENGEIKGKVFPMRISGNDSLAKVNGTTSVVRISTDLMGDLSITEHEPEILQTAYGLFSDLIRVIRERGKRGIFAADIK